MATIWEKHVVFQRLALTSLYLLAATRTFSLRILKHRALCNACTATYTTVPK